MSAFSKDFGGPLDEPQIMALIGYLRAQAPNDTSIGVDAMSVKGDPSLGADVYAKTCSGCHGDHGEGKTAPSLNNPNFLATASDGFVRYAIEHGRPSTPMQAFTNLSADEVANVTRYIRSWARTVEQTPITGESLPTRDAIVLNSSGRVPNLGALKDGRYVSADRLAGELAQKPRIILLDARPTSDWYKSHIEGAFPAPFYEDVDPLVKLLPRDGTWIVAYCACPHAASDKVIDGLRSRGFEHTAVLYDGFLVWLQRKYPAAFGRQE